MKPLSQRKSGGSDPAPEFKESIDEALEIRRDLIELTSESLDLLEHVHSSQRESAVNLLHYVALRSRDLRSFQMRLARVGMSSLGRAESHVLAAVDAVLAVLHRAVGRDWQPEKTFVPAYRTMLEACYSCHKASGKPYLRPMIPTTPPQTIINYDPNAKWPQ